ncbi:MAG: PBP1A family penicillin-binding protein [Desulfobacteraceae bacterium]|jgi:penicillin-binding protein 1B|nr:PBP1A family penicillin-binding protein [Desulfobacteraceae bacterium]
MLKKITITFLALILLIGVSLFLYGWYLAGHIEQRFSARRWSVPSKVYSDTILLYPGQRINPDLLKDKLGALGYHTVSRQPEKKGEVQTSADAIAIFLNDLKTPGNNRKGFAVRIAMSAGMIESIVRTADGTVVPILELEPEEISLFFGSERERRQLISIQQVPGHLIHAVLAAEDSRFYQHPGIDFRGIFRALITNLRHGSIRQGGSTLTQQLAKNYFLTPARTLTRKVKEILISVIIEFKYEKEEILEIYLNEIYLGQKGSVAINGVGEASYFYFGKPVKELSRAEAATIAGLIKAPNHYSPYQDNARCLSRRNFVLNAMHTKGWLSQEELKAAVRVPVKTVGFTVHGKKAPYFVDYLEQQIKTLYRPEDLASLGLSIYTTLDSQVQEAAENALAKGLEELERIKPELRRDDPAQKLQGAVIVMQPGTGYILALVGGRNYTASQFNRISQARRQPGSAFKPFVYLSGLDKFSPSDMLSNQPQTYTVDGKTWEPQNFEPVTRYTVSLRDALTMSYNLATVDLAMKTGLDHIVATASRFHFSTPLKAYPSLALGAFEVIPLELARSYCVFAADGVQPYPLSLKGVVDENGKTLEQKHLQIERLISPQKAFMINFMLQSVVTAGTARSLKNRGIFWPVAGKTGTTNDFKDAWFVGYTPDILALVWVGFDNGDPIFATGSSAALPIWAELMNSIPQYISEAGFKVPPGVEKRAICDVTGLLANENACPQPVEEYFLTEKIPTEHCPLHRKSGFKNLIRGVKKLFDDD